MNFLKDNKNLMLPIKLKKNNDKKIPPDKGLEPLALRLKVSRSTD